MPLHTFPQRAAEAEPLTIELEDVPTLLDLVQRGKDDGVEYVRIVGRTSKGEPNVFAPTAAGHALLGEIMRRNGRALAAAEATRPPVTTAPPLSAAQEAALWAREAFGDSPA